MRIAVCLSARMRASSRRHRNLAVWSCGLDDDASAKSSQYRLLCRLFSCTLDAFHGLGVDIDADTNGEMFVVGAWRDTLPLFNDQARVCWCSCSVVTLLLNPKKYFCTQLLAWVKEPHSEGQQAYGLRFMFQAAKRFR